MPKACMNLHITVTISDCIHTFD